MRYILKQNGDVKNKQLLNVTCDVKASELIWDYL